MSAPECMLCKLAGRPRFSSDDHEEMAEHIWDEHGIVGEDASPSAGGGGPAHKPWCLADKFCVCGQEAPSSERAGQGTEHPLSGWVERINLTNGSDQIARILGKLVEVTREKALEEVAEMVEGYAPGIAARIRGLTREKR